MVTSRLAAAATPHFAMLAVLAWRVHADENIESRNSREMEAYQQLALRFYIKLAKDKKAVDLQDTFPRDYWRPRRLVARDGHGGCKVKNDS